MIAWPVVRNLFLAATLVTAATLSTTTASHAQCPPARASHVAVYDATDHAMVMFGGKNGTASFSDVWTLSLPVGGTPSWTQNTVINAPPEATIEGTGVYDSARNRMLYFGGKTLNGLESQQVWALYFPVYQWVRLSVPGTAPTPRYAHSAIYDPVRDKMVVFGGYNSSNDAFADT